MEEVAEKLADIFSVFSNAKRVLIFWSLDGTEKSVNEIARSIDSSIQNTSQHLRLMKGKSILDTRRNGQTIYYRIADSDIADYCRLLHQEMFKSYFEPPSGRADGQKMPAGEGRD
jgi:DNA-binding transcriptional ArsR family regulator